MPVTRVTVPKPGRGELALEFQYKKNVKPHLYKLKRSLIVKGCIMTLKVDLHQNESYPLASYHKVIFFYYVFMSFILCLSVYIMFVKK